MIYADIQHWVDETQTSDDQPTDRPPKRRRFNDLTPSLSMDSPSDETPRAKRGRHAVDLASYSDHPSMSPSSSSARSGGRTSPLKHMRRLRHDPKGLDMRELTNFRSKPPELDIFLNKVAEFAYGKGIVSTSRKDTLVSAAASDDGFKWALWSNNHLTDEPDVHTPLPWEVLEVVEAAAECSTRNHPEATWNMEVHQHVLRMALRPTRKANFGQLVNFMPTTTAAIIPSYGNPTVSKKVDFCVYIEPENESLQQSIKYRTAIEKLRNTLPENVVNFTDFDPLDDRHVALTIETKKPGESTEAAKLQLGVWEMARWNFLRRLAGQDDDIPAVTNALPQQQPFDLPPFLPGIIAHGHDWFMVVTTTEGKKTVLWQKRLIGSTSDTRGVYQIVRTLQYMGQWVRDVHWPYLRSLIESYY